MLQIKRTTLILAVVFLAVVFVVSGAATVLLFRSNVWRASGDVDTMVVQGEAGLTGRTGAAFPLFARIDARDFEELRGGRDYGTHLGHMDGDAWAGYRVDFGEGATAMMVKVGVPAGREDCRIRVRLDRPDGPIIGDARMNDTGGDGLELPAWQEVPLKATRGVHKVYLTPPSGCGTGNLFAIRFVRDPRPATAEILFDAYDELSGIEDQGTRLGSLDQGDWVRYRKLDLGSGVSWLNANVGVPVQFAGQRLEFRVGRPDGPIVAEVVLGDSGGWGSGRWVRVPVTPVSGVHDLYVTPVGRAVGSLFAFRFEP